MKFIEADLTDDVVSVYDQTKTTIQGRCISKTINGKTVLGPPLNKFLDVVADSTVVPTTIVHMTPNGRIFVVGAETNGLVQVALYSINYTDMSTAYVGRIQFAIPDVAATTHTYRSFKAYDSGTTGWKLFLSSTASVAINGGTYCVNNVDLADFVPIGFPTFGYANGNNQKATYFLQNPSFLGVNHTAANNQNVASVGSALDRTNGLLYVHNGVAATHKYFVFNANATPTWASNSVTGDAGTDVITDTGHTYVDNDPIVFSAITGGAGLTANTVYFVRNSVPGVSYQVSATSGGAVINFTTNITAATVGRAFGTTGSMYSYETGFLPALTGTLLLTDSEDYAEPTGINVSVDGFPCVFFGTTSNLYMGRLSELTTGAVTWPSLQTCNLLGAANEITAPTAIQVAWSNAINRAIYTTNTSLFVMKPFANNDIDVVFGGLNNQYNELVVNDDTIPFGVIAIGGVDLENGILGVIGTTVGQRGVYLVDVRSHELFDHSFFVTKVLDTPQSVYNFVTTLDELFAYTGSLCVYYRTSGFGSISGGWILLPFAEQLEGITTAGDQVQFKVCFDTLGLGTSIPAQLYEFILGLRSLLDSSDQWQISKDLSSTGATHRVVYYLAKTYAGSVPTLYTRAYQQGTTTVVGSANTSANAGSYRYSTNGGVSWQSLGTIPNVVGTLVEWTISPTPTVDYVPNIRES